MSNGIFFRLGFGDGILGFRLFLGDRLGLGHDLGNRDRNIGRRDPLPGLGRDQEIGDQTHVKQERQNKTRPIAHDGINFYRRSVGICCMGKLTWLNPASRALEMTLAMVS